MPEQDAREVATEGQDRPGPYMVRKGHFVLIDDEGPGPVVPSPHRLAWKRLTNERIVFLVRDPRDICISGAWHWHQTPERFLERMIKGDVAHCGRWDRYCEEWIYNKAHLMNEHCFVHTAYETLIKDTEFEIRSVLKWVILDGEIYKKRLVQAISRQSFTVRTAQIGDNKAELRRQNMRKGIAGDWRNHFTPAMNERIWNEFGWMMEKLGCKRPTA
jgi:alcohol sulfotransferase